MITPEEMAERMKKDPLADIRDADIREGVVPRSLKTFSELHDYVDANCYGGSEALLDGLDVAVPDTDEGHTSVINALCDLMNPAIDIIHEWLPSGGTIRDLAAVERADARLILLSMPPLR